MGRLTSDMQHEACSLSALLLAAWQLTVAALWQSLRSVSRTPHSNLKKFFFFYQPKITYVRPHLSCAQ